MADLKAIARGLFRDTLAAIDVAACVRSTVEYCGSRVSAGDCEFDLREFDRIHILAVGKASEAMASGLLAALPREVSPTGLLVLPAKPRNNLPGLRTIIAGHPVPTAASFEAGRAAYELLSGCDARTLVFVLLSGGGSALMEMPYFADVTPEDMQALHRVLVTCGAPIDEINAVRKHVSAVKGGRLAALAPAALKITLGVSDVPPGRESALASGPTLPDPSRVSDVLRVARQYDLIPKLPAALARRLERGDLPETPKEGDAAFRRAHFQLVLGMNEMFHRAHRFAEAAGCVTYCDNSTDDWPLEKAADHLLAQLQALTAQNPGRPVCIIADGEVLSPVKGKGTGGRNAALVLYCVEKIAARKIAVLSAGTDGIDGNSPAAGAAADGETLARARAAGLDPRDYFERSDSYNFFNALGDAITTGPTGNNLRDLRILLAAPQDS
jgi:hydroxypyruvate reductase